MNNRLVHCQAALFALLVLLAVPGRAAQAQFRGTIAGTVRSSGGEPVGGASVAVGAPARLVRTDSLGAFRVDAIPLGDQRIEVRALGFRPEVRVVGVFGTEVVTVDVALRPAAVTLPDVVVSSSREGQLAARTPLSIEVIGAEEIRAARSHHPADLVNRAPGVYVSNFGGEGHATAIRQPISTKALYAYLEDGVPTRSTGFFNHNALYEVNLPQAGRVEIIKGPGSAVYGSDAVGGVVNSFTRDPSRAPTGELFVEGGSSTYLRALGTASTTVGAHGVRADANVTTSQGWRDGAGYDRQSATGRWDWTAGDGTRLKTVATFTHVDQPGDGGSDISAADYAAAPSTTYNPIAFRRVLAGRLSSELQLQRGPTSAAVTLYTRYNELDLMPSWQLSFDPQVWESRHRSVGVLTRARQVLPALHATVSGGVDAELSPGSRRESAIAVTREGAVFTSYAPGAVQYDYDVTFWQVSPFVQVGAAILPALQLDAGLRFDRLGYDYTNLLSPLDSGRHRRPASTAVDFARLTPKLGLAWQVLPSLSAFASYRGAFRAPSESQLFRQGSAESTVDLEPVRATSWEAGLRGIVAGVATVEATAYHMALDDDILTFFDPATGLRQTQNAGRTSHQGVELGVGVSPVPTLRLDAAASYAVHRYDAWVPRPGTDYSGNEMELAPRLLGQLRLTWRPAPLRDGALVAEITRLGAYYMDPENTHRYDGHTLVNLQGTVGLTDALQLTGRVSNLLDARYAETSSYNTQQGERFRPGAPRQVFVGAQYRFGS